MQEVVIYTTHFCPYCIRAKRLLSGKGVTYREIAVDNKPNLRAQMAAMAGRRSVPQIWIGDCHVGGCDDLMALERGRKLDDLLKAAS
ncbi:glutaredoxin 3 [Microbulbifer sp. 2304DJ12-6]|uniref:glutaredoxin 3 n=1 Tax=Microbulbifer sp. 2304DJ12-6 TaxID=3233340 RepID=UPI00261EC045|nr:glutaredoxin 3 [uncultured Microbulbifer sp.]